MVQPQLRSVARGVDTAVVKMKVDGALRERRDEKSASTA